MNKCEQRKLIKSRLKQLNHGERLNYSLIIVDKLRRLIHYYKPNNIMSYQPIQEEVDLTALNKEFDCFYPVIVGENMISGKSKDYVVNKYGIKEPLIVTDQQTQTMDLIIVPLIGFDENNNRLGRGKGYYDRFLKGYVGLKIGVGYECQKLNNIIVEKSDVKMDIIITEREIYGRNIDEIKKYLGRK
ncbi:MAG: 5-formyltetrahydrofolate cyclo-ligase [Erysipelotrichia bacterium]|nr:5-formyltetrahydrofolate cyclo-ligase [Erysipelotrichia bacterium]